LSIVLAGAMSDHDAANSSQAESAFDPLDLDTPIKFNYPQTAKGKLDECIRIKEIANARFKAKMFWPAIRTYARAVAYIKGLDGGNALNQRMGELFGRAPPKLSDDSNDEEDLKSEIKAQNIFLNTNIAFAYFKLGKFEKSLEFCDKALEMDPGYPKALLRKAEALVGLNLLGRAKEIVDTVRREAPDFMGAKTLQKLQDKIRKQQKKNDKKQRKQFAGMFSKKTSTTVS